MRANLTALDVALALSGQGAASARIVGSGLRVVYGRVRHARSEGGEGAAGGIGDVRSVGAPVAR